jgi:hypothetical protein
MLMLSVVRPVAAIISKLVTLVLARWLHLPEPVVHDTGLFVFVQVQAIENRIGKALCPIRRLRQLRALFQS